MIVWGARPESGPLAPPGDYSVRLTASAVTQAALLRVEKDPRLPGVSEADLFEQFKLATEVRDRVTEADEIVIRIRDIKGQLKDRGSKTKDPNLNAASERLEAKLTAMRKTPIRCATAAGRIR